MIHLNKAVTLIKAGDMQQALSLLDSLLIAGKNEKYQYEMALTQAVIGIVEASYVNNVRKAQEYAQQALLVFEGLHQKI